jgi:5-methylcytosine-specific restriction endonuclease McrA
MTKKNIPKALREQVWIKKFGHNFEAKCPISWCKNNISVFNYEVGHNKPESLGGSLDLENLLPICGKCNKSMSNNYSIDQWNKLDKKLMVENGEVYISENKLEKKKKGQIKSNIKSKAKWYCCFMF